MAKYLGPDETTIRDGDERDRMVKWANNRILRLEEEIGRLERSITYRDGVIKNLREKLRKAKE